MNLIKRFYYNMGKDFAKANESEKLDIYLAFIIFHAFILFVIGSFLLALIYFPLIILVLIGAVFLFVLGYLIIGKWSEYVVQKEEEKNII